MSATSTGVTTDFVRAVLAGDLAGAAALLTPDVSFRALTPNRVWEAGTPAEVEEVLRQWLADPDEELESIEPTETASVEDVTRVGWRVRISDADGPGVFEQQVYLREADGRICWIRALCSGARPRTDAPSG